MEGISASLYKGLRENWKRRDYQRLDGSNRFRRRKNRVELFASSEDGTGQEQQQRRRKRFWRIKVTPKLRFFAGMASPKKLFRGLRDAYVKMMLGFANSRIFISGYGGGGGGSFGMAKPTLKEYDQKVIIEIYKSLMAQGQLLPHDAARLAAATARS